MKDWRGNTIYSMLAFVLAFFLVFLLKSESQAAEWPMFGNDPGNTRSQPDENIISPETVANLQVKWKAQVGGFIIKNPAVDESFVYLTTSQVVANSPAFIYKLDKFTGQVVQGLDIQAVVSQCPATNYSPTDIPPTLDIQTSPAIDGNELVVTTAVGVSGVEIFPLCDFSNPDSILPDCYRSPAFPRGEGFVVVMDKDTFACKSATLVTDHPLEGILGSTTMASLEKKRQMSRVAVMGISGYEEQSTDSLPKYPCCSTIGKVVAVDIDSGMVKWSTALIDAIPSTPQYDAVKINKKGKKVVDVTGYAGVTVWSSPPMYDQKNGQFIVTTGNAYTINRNATPPEALEPEQLPVDAFVAIDANNGKIKNVYRAIPNDFWNVNCLPSDSGNQNCRFDPVGPDHDFSAGASLIENVLGPTGPIDIAVAINKAANVYAVDTKTLSPFWIAPPAVGPSNLAGLGGTATDQFQIYATNPSTIDLANPLPPDCDFQNNPLPCIVSREWALIGGPNEGHKVYGGTLSALDLAGNVLWQNSDAVNFLTNSQAIGQNLPTVFSMLNTSPEQQNIITQFILPSLDVNGTAPYLGPPTVANGVVFAESLYPNLLQLEDEVPFELTLAAVFPHPNMFAFDAVTGNLLWQFAASSLSPFGLPAPLDVVGNPVIAAPSVVDGIVYWGAIDFGTLGNSSILYSFEAPHS